MLFLKKATIQKDKLFPQNGDPSKNIRMTNNATYIVGAKKFSIPAQNLDSEPHQKRV